MTPAYQMKCPHVRGAQFLAARGFCCPSIRLQKRAACPCHDASFPSVIILNMPLYLLPCTFGFAREPARGHLRTMLWSKCVTHRSLSRNQRCSQAAASHFTHWEPGTTVAADVRIWLLGQLFESEGTHFLVEINHNCTFPLKTVISWTRFSL